MDVGTNLYNWQIDTLLYYKPPQDFDLVRVCGQLLRAPRWSCPTTWNEFLPISMPITAITQLLDC
jgi:hypothetical protein